MEIEKLKPCPFCKRQLVRTTNACVNKYGKEVKEDFYSHDVTKYPEWCPAEEIIIGNNAKDITAWNTRAIDENPPLTLILPARVGDSIVVKDGDSTETLRIDGFELRGDELMVWGEGENERYVAFAPDEIIKYIPKEEGIKWLNNFGTDSRTVTSLSD